MPAPTTHTSARASVVSGENRGVSPIAHQGEVVSPESSFILLPFGPLGNLSALIAVRALRLTGQRARLRRSARKACRQPGPARRAHPIASGTARPAGGLGRPLPRARLSRGGTGDHTQRRRCPPSG